MSGSSISNIITSISSINTTNTADTIKAFEELSVKDFQITELRYYYISMGHTGDIYMGAKEIQTSDVCPTLLKPLFMPHLLIAGTVHLVSTVISVVCFQAKPQHWYAVLHNIEDHQEYVLEFGRDGVSLRSCGSSQAGYLLQDVRPSYCVRSGRAIADWLDGLSSGYNVWANNCQDFVKSLCRFM